MSDLRKVINVLSLGPTKDSAAKTLEATLSGSKNSGNVWTLERDGFTFRGYIKCPGLDHFEEIEVFTDVILVTAPATDKTFSEIMNYVQARKDCPRRLLVDETDRTSEVSAFGLTWSSQSNVNTVLAEHAKWVATLNTTYAKFSDSTYINEESKCNEFLTAMEVDEVDVVTYRLEVENPEDENNKRYSYSALRHYLLNCFDKSEESHRDWMKAAKAKKQLAKMIRYLSNAMDTFTKKQTTLPGSTNTGKFEFTTGGEQNGVGVHINLLVGDAYQKKYELEPLLVRDNPFTASLELSLKSKDEAENAYKGLKSLYDFADMMGVLKESTHLGFSVEIRKGENQNVFVDLTWAPVTSSYYVADLRRLNLSTLNISVDDEFKILTNVTVGDVVNDFSLDNVITKGSSLNISGDAQILNMKNLFRVLRDGVGMVNSDRKAKDLVLATTVLMMLTTFETLSLKLGLNGAAFKEIVVEVLGSMNEEGGYEALCEQMNAQVGQGFLPMGIQTMQSVKPMLEPYMGLLKSLNFDRLHINVQSPVLRGLVRVGLHLPGTTDFITKNLLD